MVQAVPYKAITLERYPLHPGERLALKAALTKVGLPTEDIEAPGRLFWRFEIADQIPVGFGGLEICGDCALLRSLVTLPPVRGRGIGSAMVAALEAEAALHHCRSVFLITQGQAGFFGRFGYVLCDRAAVPEAIRSTRQYADLCPQSAEVLVKRLD
jgi:N-acetylglutamate synthase-like GNAT family acetyltransferase